MRLKSQPITCTEGEMQIGANARIAERDRLPTAPIDIRVSKIFFYVFRTKHCILLVPAIFTERGLCLCFRYDQHLEGERWVAGGDAEQGAEGGMSGAAAVEAEDEFVAR